MHEFEVAKCNSTIWKNVISQNENIDTQVASLSLADFRMEDVDHALPASMQIHLKGSPHTLSVGPEDDTNKLTDAFVLKHNLKSDIKPRIEAELLRTQVDSCLAFQHKLRTQIAHLRRLVIESSIYEPRALAAEALANRTRDELQGLGQISVQISEKMTALRAECDEKTQIIATLTSDLLKEQTAIHQFKEASSMQLETCQNEIEILQKKVKTQQKKLRKESSQEVEEDDSIMLQEAIAEIEAKNQLLEQQERRICELLEQHKCRVNELLGMNEALEVEKSKIKRSHTECAETNATLQRRLEDLKLSEQHNASITSNLKRRVVESDEEIKTLRKQLKTANEKAEMTEISEQLNESKIKKMTEDCRRATSTIQSLTQKQELASVGFEASRLENRALQEQLQAAEAQLLAFKNHSSAKLLRNVTEENAVLKEQSIRLRGEVLALQAKLEEIESSAFSAVHSMQLLQNNNNNVVGGGSPPTRSPQKSSSQKVSAFASIDSGGGRDEEKVIVELIMEDDSLLSDYQSDRNIANAAASHTTPTSNNVEDEDTDTDIEVDFNIKQSFPGSAKEDEKSAAALSPIVEDRLLRNIYSKYTTETSEQLTLTRCEMHALFYSLCKLHVLVVQFSVHV